MPVLNGIMGWFLMYLLKRFSPEKCLSMTTAFKNVADSCLINILGRNDVLRASVV